MAYTRDYLHIDSGILGRSLEMLRFGDQGSPLLCFPTSNGRFFDLEDRGIIASLKPHIESGSRQVFCAETLDSETFFNGSLSLAERRERWLALERHWTDELIPYIQATTQQAHVDLAGFSFGATHALNLTCRHPDRIRRCLAFAGPYDLAHMGHWGGWDPAEAEQEWYFINPMAYLSNMSATLWQELGGHPGQLFLLSATEDHCLGDNQRLHEILSGNGIPHELHIWEGGHDWPVWQAQVAAFI